MGRKKDKSESKKPENVMNIHKECFIKFLNYLRDHDTEINTKSKPGRFGNSPTHTNSFKSDYFSNINLIEEARILKYTKAVGYISR